MRHCTICDATLHSSLDEYGLDLTMPVCQACYFAGIDRNPDHELHELELQLHELLDEIDDVEYMQGYAEEEEDADDEDGVELAYWNSRMDDLLKQKREVEKRLKELRSLTASRQREAL